ncbi:TKN1 protein, partial [Polyodon spathula]|nr:TKN1 protein [Polyodon spathula]
MKLLLAFMVVFLVLAELFCEEAGAGEDLNYWTDSNQIQDEWLAPDSFKEILRRITRKPKPHQFFGLMGKRSSGKICPVIQHCWSTVKCATDRFNFSDEKQVSNATPFSFIPSLVLAAILLQNTSCVVCYMVAIQ